MAVRPGDVLHTALKRRASRAGRNALRAAAIVPTSCSNTSQLLATLVWVRRRAPREHPTVLTARVAS